MSERPVADAWGMPRPRVRLPARVRLEFQDASNPFAARVARQDDGRRRRRGWRLGPGGHEHGRERGRQDGDGASVAQEPEPEEADPERGKAEHDAHVEQLAWAGGQRHGGAGTVLSQRDRPWTAIAPPHPSAARPSQRRTQGHGPP